MTGPARLGVALPLGSLTLLLAALWAELVWGLPPCPLCHGQRAGHLIALVGAVGLFRRSAPWAGLGALGVGLSGLLGLYQAGAEAGWWVLRAGCGGAPDLSGLSPEAALARMLATGQAACDQAPWVFAGLSLAGWNALLSGLLLTGWALLIRRLSR